MQPGSTILIIVATISVISYFVLRQWRYEQHLSTEAKRLLWRQQLPLIIFLTTLLTIGLATLARVNAILLISGGILAAGVLFALPALQFYHYSQRETIPRKQAIMVYSVHFLLSAFLLAVIFVWLRMFGVL